MSDSNSQKEKHMPNCFAQYRLQSATFFQIPLWSLQSKGFILPGGGIKYHMEGRHNSSSV